MLRALSIGLLAIATSATASGGEEPSPTESHLLMKMDVARRSRDWETVRAAYSAFAKNFPGEDARSVNVVTIMRCLFAAGSFTACADLCDRALVERGAVRGTAQRTSLYRTLVWSRVYACDATRARVALAAFVAECNEAGEKLNAALRDHLVPDLSPADEKAPFQYRGHVALDEALRERMGILRADLAATKEWCIATLKVTPEMVDDVRVIVRDERAGDSRIKTIEEIRGDRLGATIVVGAENLARGTIAVDGVAGLKHEYVHALQIAANSRCGRSVRAEPRWLIEGLAIHGAGNGASDLVDLYQAHVGRVADWPDFTWDIDDNSEGGVAYINGILFVEAVDEAFGQPIMARVLRRSVRGEVMSAVLEDECGVDFGSIARKCRPIARERLGRDMAGSAKYFDGLSASRANESERAFSLLSSFVSEHPGSVFRRKAEIAIAEAARRTARVDLAMTLLDKADREDSYPPRVAAREGLRILCLASKERWADVVARGDTLLGHWRSRSDLKAMLAEAMARGRAAVEDQEQR